MNGISFDGITNSLKNLFSSHNIKGGDVLVNSVKNIFTTLNSAIKEGIGEFKKNLSIFNLSDILKTMLVGFAGFKAFKMFKGGGGFLAPILDPLKELVEKGDEIVSKVSGVLDGLKDAISSFTLGIKAGTLFDDRNGYHNVGCIYESAIWNVFRRTSSSSIGYRCG